MGLRKRKKRPSGHPRHMLFMLVFVCFMGLPVEAPGAENDLKKASFIPHWVPQAQFAGYYLARDLGIYRKHGIDLTIIDGGPDRASDEYLRRGMADFASLWLCTGITMREQGVKLVNIGQMMQRSALMLVAKKSRGIRTPEDLDGKKVGLWGPIFQIQPRAFFKKYNLDVTIVRQSYSVNLFLRDGVDAASAMWYNEYHTILNSGLNPEELTTFFFYNHGLNFPEDAVFALEETFEKDAGLCKAFVRASIEGWRYAFDHPEAALDIVMRHLKEAHVPTNRVHQRWMIERMDDLMRPEGLERPMGTLVETDYRRVAAGLEENDFIKDIPDFRAFYRVSQDHAEK